MPAFAQGAFRRGIFRPTQKLVEVAGVEPAFLQFLFLILRVVNG